MMDWMLLEKEAKEEESGQCGSRRAENAGAGADKEAIGGGEDL